MPFNSCLGILFFNLLLVHYAGLKDMCFYIPITHPQMAARGRAKCGIF